MPAWQTRVSVLNPSWLELVDCIIIEGQYGELIIYYTAAQIFSLFWAVFYIEDIDFRISNFLSFHDF